MGAFDDVDAAIAAERRNVAPGASAPAADMNTKYGPPPPDTSTSGGMFDRMLVSKPSMAAPSPPKTWGETLSLENIRNTLDPSTRGIVEGIPAAGPVINQGIAGAAALPSALIPGRTVSGSYNDIMQEGERNKAAHPISSAIGQTTGSVVSTVPVARAFPKVFGGNSFTGQTAAGGVLGGTDAAVRSGGDPTETAKGAFIGAAGPTMGSLFAPVGQAISSAGRWVGQNVPGVKSLVPKRAELNYQGALDAGDQGYKSLGGMATYDPAARDDLVRLAWRDIRTGSIGTKDSAPNTFRIMNDLTTMPSNPASLHNVRKQLQETINTAGAGSAEGQSALYAKNKIDQFLSAPPPNAVVTAPGVQPADVFRTLKEADTNWRQGMTVKNVRDRVAKAEVDASAENKFAPILAEGSETRKQVRNLLKSNRQAKFLQPEDTEALQGVASGSLGERALQVGGLLSGTRSGLGSLLPGSLSYLGLGGWPGVAAVTVGGGLANAATTGLTRRAVNEAERSILSRSPYGQAELAAARPPSVIGYGNPVTPGQPIGPIPYRNEIARLIALQGERAAVEE
jgi:hypothetical protein